MTEQWIDNYVKQEYGDLYVRVHKACGVRAVNILKNHNIETEEQLRFVLKTTDISLKWYLCGRATEKKLRDLFDIPKPEGDREDVRIKALITQIRALSPHGKRRILDAIWSEEAEAHTPRG